MDRSLLEKKALVELREIASALELRGFQRMKKADLIDLIIETGSSGNGANGTEAGGNGSDATGSTATQGAQAHGAATGSGEPGRTGEATGSSEASADDGGRTSTRVRARQRSSGDDDRASRGSGEDEPSGEDDRSSQARTDGGRDKDRDQQGAGQATGPGQSAGGGQEAGEGQGSGGGRDQDDSRNKRGERRRKGRGQGQGQQQGAGQQDNLEDAEVREGVLDLLPEGYGFLRTTGYLSGDRDVYVSQSFVRRFDLRRGDKVAGPIRRNKNNDKFPALARVDTIEGTVLDPASPPEKRPAFKDLTPLFPTERLHLELEESTPMSMRLVEMMAPIGKGQRGLLVSPPKAGKTTVLKQLAASIEANQPDVHLMVLLVDERPEEVTDFERSTKGEVISSTFDRPAEDHTQVAELCIERAKRLVETGRDVVVLLDSITRLGRAYNLAIPTSGKVLSGGVDSAALYPPKRFFGAARNIEEGGSLTIIASALIDTGSKMDEVIFEEFKGTGNMELRLDRRLEQKRIFPAIDIQASGTRREELLLGEDQLETIWKLRRLLATMDAEASLQLLIDKLRATKSNSQFLQMIAKSNLQ